MRYIAITLTALLLAFGWFETKAPAQRSRPIYHSPQGIAYSPNGRELAVADRTAGQVAILDGSNGTIRGRISVRDPRGVQWSRDGATLYAASGDGGVAQIDVKSTSVTHMFAAHQGTTCLAQWFEQRAVLCTNADTHDVQMLDAISGKPMGLWKLNSEPYGIAVAQNRGLAVVGHLIANSDASAPDVGASITFIDLRAKTQRDIKLPTGATDVRGVAVSPDERYAYVVHGLGHTTTPTSLVDGGWVNNYALSIIDLQRQRVYASLMLDSVLGAVDPWGVAVSNDGDTLWVALSAVRSLVHVDIGRVLERAQRAEQNHPTPVSPTGNYTGYILDPQDCVSRVELKSDGPRELALSPDGKRLVVGAYFDGRICVLDPSARTVTATWSLGAMPADDAIRRGERIFHDATNTHLAWLSCATCHPDGRADGVNWDLLNDGAGNPKNTRSMLNATRRGLMMSHGIRANASVAIMAGFHFTEYNGPGQSELEAVKAYIGSLKPRRSPYLQKDGTLSAQARRGKALFEGSAGCSGCHSGSLFTDNRVHDVGTRQSWDTGPKFITASLVEVWRTAPYLHDGAATTIYDVLTQRNPHDQHGRTRGLSPQQLRDLQAYVLSL